jgi:DNA-binding transcriptional ArsR family regulator
MASPDPLFKALSDPTRRALFERLCREGALPVHVLTDGAGISQPAVSKHLVQLRGAGLVRAEAQGRETIYRAEPHALAPLADWLADSATFWSARLDALGDLLKRMDQ